MAIGDCKLANDAFDRTDREVRYVSLELSFVVPNEALVVNSLLPVIHSVTLFPR